MIDSELGGDNDELEDEDDKDGLAGDRLVFVLFFLLIFFPFIFISI